MFESVRAWGSILFKPTMSFRKTIRVPHFLQPAERALEDSIALRLSGSCRLRFIDVPPDALSLRKRTGCKGLISEQFGSGACSVEFLRQTGVG